MRSRSDRDQEVKLSWVHTVTLKHTDINFRVTDSVATRNDDFRPRSRIWDRSGIYMYLKRVRTLTSAVQRFTVKGP